MSWEDDRKTYAEKLRRVMESIDDINAIQGNRLITPEMNGSLRNLRAKAARLYPRLKDGLFEIAVIGMEKAGKSSFVNAYLERVILPTANKRCTYTSTCVRHSTDKDRGLVEFYNKQEFDRLFSQKLAELGIPDADKWNMSSLGLEQYRQLYDKYASPDKKKLYDNTLNKEIEETIANKAELEKYINHPDLIFEDNELDSEDFKSFITEPGRAMAVRNVTIFSTKLGKMKDAILYDVPGFDSPTAMHKEQTKRQMAEADVVIMIANGELPSLTLPAVDMYTENPDEYGCPVRDKIFVFANKADKVATREQLEDNKSETYKEWIDRHKIVPAGNRNRFVFGSTNAVLGNLVPGGEESRQKMDSFQMDYGLAELKGKLDSYYSKERLPALITQVNQLRHEVEAVFSELDKLNLEEDQSITLSNDLYGKLLDEQRVKLKKLLEDLHVELRTHINSEKPLRKDISNKISACIDEETYKLTEEEKNEIHKTFATIGDPEQPEKLDGLFREKRFKEMHGNFTSAILGSVVEQHDRVRQEILKRFMDSLDVDASNPGLEQLKKNTEIFCGLDKGEDEAYYNSLIERFARDLFEVQISMCPGRGRLNKFKEEASNFFSLGVFYDNGQETEGEEINFTNPANSRLWRIILYPESLAGGEKQEEGSVSGYVQEVLRKLKEKIKIENLGPVIEGLIMTIVAAKGRTAWVAIEAALKTMQKGSSPVNRLKETKNLLEELARNITPEASAAPESETSVFDGMEYLESVNRKHLNHSYAMVADEFSNDVKALRETLLKAFVPAINLDKAFVAKEAKIIEDIKEKLASSEFRKYLSDNLYTIRRAQMADIKQLSEQRLQDSAVLAHIKTILGEMDSIPQNVAEEAAAQ